jgi:hypothetical protein
MLRAMAASTPGARRQAVVRQALRVTGPLHQFRTRNDLANMQRAPSNANEPEAKSTNLIDILPLITVWLQVRVMPGQQFKARPLLESHYP